MFCQLLENLSLKLSAAKTKSVTFSKPHNLKRPPVIRINNVSVNHVNHLKLLGITIDKNQSYIEHINQLKLKLTAYYLNTCKMMGKNWGLKTDILKTWYNTIIEKILTYGAGVWAGDLTAMAQSRLGSIQRLFLLQMSRGYRTASTDALCALTGVPPIRLILDYESTKSKITHLKDAEETAVRFPGLEIQHLVPGWILHPADETSHEQVNIKKNSHKASSQLCIYTDGSRTDTGVAAAFCVIKGEGVSHRWGCRLGDNNTVYQAELTAIQEALTWLQNNPNSETKTLLFSDSLSALQAIHKHRAKHPIVVEIKRRLGNLKDKVALAHVLAHRGTFGNELADQEAKAATEKPVVELDLPVPHSYIKRNLKLQLFQNWQNYWDLSDKGRHTHSLIPRIGPFNYSLTPAITAFLTGHGPFKEYLARFHRSASPNCECGSLGTADHYFYHCELTQQWHIKKPNPPPKDWLHNILTRPRLRSNLTKIYDFCRGLANLT